MAGQEPKAVYQQLIEAVNQRNLAVIDELVAPDFVGHWLFAAPELHGREAYRQWFETLVRVFPDWRGTIEDLVAEGETVVARWRVQGTLQQEWTTAAGRTIPGRGQRMDIQGVHLVRVRDGQLVEQWHSQDVLTMLQQLDALSTAGQPPA